MPHFSEEEKALLAPYVTGTDDDIFAVTNLQGIVGAVYARYSRAQGGFRETLLKEFIKEGMIDTARAQDLIERILIAYGDDSVGELEGAHLSFENISILSTKEIEDRRIGGSPIEQSTRYVFYDQKDTDDNFRYYRDPAVMASAHGAAYTETMDFIFETYCRLIEPMKAFYMARKPLEEAEYGIRADGAKIRYAECADEKEQKAFRTTYNADIRTKACDTLRALLPVATKTNVGIFGNGRFFQTVLSYCYSSALPEAQDIATRAHAALDKVIPRYVKRAKTQEYAVDVRGKMQTLADKLFKDIAPAAQKDVDLLGRGETHIAAAAAKAPGDVDALRNAMRDEEDNLMIACMLFLHVAHPLRQVREVVRDLLDETKQEIISTYLGDRKTRRDRPGRALEAGYPYTFDVCCDFGAYKDLERHRMCTQLRQRFTPTIGFVMPEDLVAAGFEADAKACVEKASALYELLHTDFPEQASYATLHGSKVRWVLGMNDRALMHMIELRTQPAGHPAYRRICQEMQRQVVARSSWRGDAMRFTDHGEYFWARADSEARQRVKEAALEGAK